jgi:hypothetical protein
MLKQHQAPVFALATVKFWCMGWLYTAVTGLPLLSLQATVMDMKSALEGRIRRAEDIAAAFAHFKREVCLAAEHSKTGRPVGEKALAALEERGELQGHDMHCTRICTAA